jgi:hypothetical protein
LILKLLIRFKQLTHKKLNQKFINLNLIQNPHKIFHRLKIIFIRIILYKIKIKKLIDLRTIRIFHFNIIMIVISQTKFRIITILNKF